MDTSWAHSTMGYAMECLVPEEYSNKTMTSLTMDLASREASRFALLLYIANPNATTHQNPEDVPDYFSMIAPNVITLMITEIILRGVMTGVESYRVNDLMASLGSAVIFMAISAPTRSIEIFLYESVFVNRLFTFDWDSPVTWWIAAITVDFLFYWFHRFAHETNIGWAGHQVHHGSEDYNLTTSIRQSAILKLYTIIFYLPLAYVGVPLSAVLVHMQLNIIYQLWLHTELVSTLGPLEWIFNTPSHHRVHHGSEPWCLDKNYAGVLIIWDRMFGTFQPEIKDKKIIYGLVDQPQSMNALYLETFYYKNVYDKFVAQTRWVDRLKAIFYGPGWTPGAPRLGHPLPEPPADQPPRKKYDPQLPHLLEAYLFVHFLIAGLVQQAAMVHFKTLSGFAVICHTCYALSTMGAIGGMYDGWSGAMKVEALRCTGYLVYSSIFPVLDGGIIDRLVQAYLALSIVVWSLQSVSRSNKISWERKLL